MSEGKTMDALAKVFPSIEECETSARYRLRAGVDPASISVKFMCVPLSLLRDVPRDPSIADDATDL